MRCPAGAMLSPQLQGIRAIEGLSLKLHSSIRDCLEARSFKKMKRLRLLQLDHVQLSGDYGYLLPLNWMLVDDCDVGCETVEGKSRVLEVIEEDEDVRRRPLEVQSWRKPATSSHLSHLIATIAQITYTTSCVAGKPQIPPDPFPTATPSALEVAAD
ncbi:hypothetical protein LR48_Vigan03g186100 [Vigna angularis]|uniref:Uncharacterized protein n=1 Tax=Phaseolus angularis TaxID=3914 RepID=A0A0L9U7R8_PHAAN|nr:hypothetical protein LR48_Vigan03g186100 [Vigna angularis]